MTAPYDLDRESLEAICELSFLRGSGPGGQHRNKVETAVRLVHPPSGVVIVSAEHRSQLKNREAAFERLIAKLKGHEDVFELLKYFSFFGIGAVAEEFIAGDVPGQTNS